MEQARLLTAKEREELNMIFSFDHLETPGHDRFDDYEYDLNYYREHVDNGEAPNEVFGTILTATREHGRVLLPWNENIPKYHEKVQQKPREEITQLYKMLIKLRSENKAFAYGGFEVLDKSQDRFVYKRSLGDDIYIIDCNLGEEYVDSYSYHSEYEMIYSSCDDNYRSEYGYIYSSKLAPYEARIMKINN